MSELSPYPINYPYQALEAHDARGRKGCLSLEKDDLGKVLSTDDNKVCVTLPRLGLGVAGWVPSSVIEIGTTRRAGDTVYSTDMPYSIDPGDIESFEIPQSHSFGKTLAAYMVGMRNAQNELPMLPRWVGSFINAEETSTAAVKHIVDGTIKAGLLECFNDYDVTIDRIITAGEHITWETRHNFNFSLIYVIILKFSDGMRKPEVYIGKTADGAARYDHHLRSKKEGTTVKDTAHHVSSAMYMIPICVLDELANDDHLRSIAEQFFVNLFGSYCRVILVLDDDTDLPGSLNSPAEKASFISRWYNDCMHASLFSKFAASVFDKVGWTPLCKRPEFGAFRGLNWQSPLGAEPAEDKIIWTMMNSKKMGVAKYTRRPKPAIAHGNGSIQVLSIRSPHEMENFQLKIPENEPGPPIGTPVIVSFEIMHDGKPHPVPWARLPRVCRFRDVDLANSLGLKISWTDPMTSKFLEKYVQSKGLMISRDDAIPGSLANYGSATGIIRFLQREKLLNEEGFDSDLGLAHVKEVKFIHLKQLIDIRDLDFGTDKGHAREVRKPEMRTLREVGDMLWALNAENIDGVWQQFSQCTGQEENRKLMCDSCFVLSKGFYADTSSRRSFCEQVSGAEDGPPQCGKCRTLGRPCSWTATAKLGPDTELFKALCPPPLNSSTISESADPVLRDIVRETVEQDDQAGAIGEPTTSDLAATAVDRPNRGRGRGGRPRGSRGQSASGRGQSGNGVFGAGVRRRGRGRGRETVEQRGIRMVAEQPWLGGTVEVVGYIEDSD